MNMFLHYLEPESKFHVDSVDDDMDHSPVRRVLLVEDDKVDQRAFRRFVSEQQLPYDLSVAGSVAEATAALEVARFDLLIVDYTLGDGTALDILALANGIPVVLVTGTGNEDIAVKAMKMGAYDYLVKTHDCSYLKMLPITVENAIRRYEAEERIRGFYAELETRVRERTQELVETNWHLQEALVLAEAGVKARDEFLSNVTHELVTPLNSIVGFSQLLLDNICGTLNDKQRDYLQKIMQSGESLNETYREILQVARLQSSGMPLQVDLFLLKVTLEESLLAFGEKAAAQGVTISLESLMPPETMIEADRGKLRQVMFNLLDNAVKFTNAGGAVSVSARLVNNEGEGAPVIISVTDTGIGIKNEDMAWLFKPFQQLEPVYTKRYKGIGLGLLLAKKLVELHGGRIWAESTFGEGSRFSFVIPVRQTNVNKHGRINEDDSDIPAADIPVT